MDIIPQNEEESCEQARQFLALVFGRIEGRIGDNCCLWTLHRPSQAKHSTWFTPSADAFDRIARKAVEDAATKDVYVTCTAQRFGGEPDKRGKNEHASWFPAFRIDLDTADGEHKAQNLPTTAQVATTAKYLFGHCPPTIIVKSGGGVHLWWILTEPVEIPSENKRHPYERRSIVAMTQTVHDVCAAFWTRTGWKLDNTSELARVLRVPGTRNHKTTPPQPVTAKFHPERLYDFTDLCRKFEDVHDAIATICAQMETDGVIRIEPKGTSTGTTATGTGAITLDDAALIALETEYDGENYKGVSKTERHDRYRSYLENYPPAISGEKGHVTILRATAHRHGFGVTAKTALAILAETYNPRCEPPWTDAELVHKVNDARPLESHPPGCRLVESTTTTPAPTAPAEREEEAPQPPYTPPPWAEVMDAIKGSPLEQYVRISAQTIENPPLDFLLSDAIQLGGMILADRGVKAGLSKTDYGSKLSNIYACKLGPPSRGKGLTSRILLAAIKGFGLSILVGESRSAIAWNAKGDEDHVPAPFGLYHVPEIARLLSINDAAMQQITTCLLESYDHGALIYSARPRSKIETVTVDPFAPSVLCEGQPEKIRSVSARGSIGTGFGARFLVSQDSGFKPRKLGFPDVGAIKVAYSGLLTLPLNMTVVRPPDTTTDPAGLSEDAEAAWARLTGDYQARIAMMLDPAQTAKGWIGKDLMARAEVVCRHYLAGSIRLVGLCHSNPEMGVVDAMEEYVTRNPGATTRAVYRSLKITKPVFDRIIVPSAMARGYIAEREGKWFPRFQAQSVTVSLNYGTVKPCTLATLAHVPNSLRDGDLTLNEVCVAKEEGQTCKSLDTKAVTVPPNRGQVTEAMDKHLVAFVRSGPGFELIISGSDVDISDVDTIARTLAAWMRQRDITIAGEEMGIF